MDGYVLLANAVIEQAVKDYAQALRNSGGADTDDTQALENWFVGETFTKLTEIDGSYLLRRVRQECELRGFQLRKAKRFVAGRRCLEEIESR